MATRQIFIVRSDDAPSNSATRYAAPTQTLTHATVEAAGQMVWPTAGIFSNLKVRVATAPGLAASGKSWAFTLRKNGSSQTLTCTISETAVEAQDTTNSFSIAAGDLLTLQVVPANTPTALGVNDLQVALEFVGTNPGESGYGWLQFSMGTSVTRVNGVFAGMFWSTGAGIGRQNVVAADGSITALYAHLSGPPGVGASYTFTLYKNGVKQDGAGGTVNTTVAITGNVATSGNSSFTLPLVGGDTVYLEVIPAGSPALRSGGASVCFLATTDGESQMCGWSDATNNLTRYIRMPQYGGAVNATESVVQMMGGVTGFRLQKLYVDLTAAPGSGGDTLTYDIRKNAASPAGTPTVAIVDAATENADTTGFVDLIGSDLWNLRMVPAVSPAARAGAWASIQKPTPPSDLVATPNDSLTVTENLRLIADTLLTKADVVTITEALAIEMPSFAERLVVENVLISEFVRAVLGIQKTVADAVTITEAVTAMLLLITPVSASDSVTITEFIQTLLTPLVVRVHDNIAISEYLLADAVGKQVFDRIRITEFVQIAVNALVLRVHDTITVTEGALNAGVLGGTTVVGPSPAPVPPTPTPPGNTGLVDYWTVGI